MRLFRDTQPAELPEILKMERDESAWVNTYDEARHRACIDADSDRHISVFSGGGETLVGFVILEGVKNPHKSLEFRRIVIRDKGKGHGRAAIRWVKKYCFEKLEFHRLWLDVFTHNARAIHLYESEGFHREGMLRDALFVDGHFRSLYLYSLLDWEYWK